MLPVPGITFGGKLPNDLELLTIFSAGIAQRSQHVAIARELISYLAFSDHASVIKEKGWSPCRNTGDRRKLNYRNKWHSGVVWLIRNECLQTIKTWETLALGKRNFLLDTIVGALLPVILTLALGVICGLAS